jgi:hypothetical protein
VLARLVVSLAALGAFAAGDALVEPVAVAPVASLQEPPAQCKSEVGLNSKFGRPVSVDVGFHKGYTKSKSFLPTDGATPRAIRLALRAQTVTGSGWTLNIRDSGLRLLASYSSADFAASGGRIWTGRFAVPNLAVELLNSNDGDRVIVEKAIFYDAPGSGGSLFSTAEKNPNWQALSNRQEWEDSRMGDAVGMMVASELSANGSLHSWCCSGVMVTPTLYLTNWHCGGTAPVPGALLWENDMRETTLIDLGWDDGPRNRQYRATEIVAQSEALDFALVRVVATRGQGGDDIPVHPAKLANQLPASGTSLKIIHHPMCLPKQISFMNCNVGRRTDAWRKRSDGSRPTSDFVHSCDTEAGSSGGPIFGPRGEVVGLHHLGYELNAQCVPANKENRAIAIDAIMEEVSKVAPVVHAEILAAQR